MSETHLQFYERWSALAQPYFDWQYKQFAPYVGRKIGDVGCGLGNFVKYFKKKELYLGFEPDEVLLTSFRMKYLADNVKLATISDITNPAIVNEMRENQLDTLLCVNVLEHIQDDALALRHIITGVTSGGHICILVPALKFIYGTLDELDGHYRRYSRKSLFALVERAGGGSVRVIKSYYINFIGAFAWFVKGKIIKEREHTNQNYFFMNKILPLVSSIENKIRPPIGMSYVLILQKTNRE